MDSINQVRDDTPTHFINPLKITVQVGVRDEKNKEEIVEIPSLQVVTHPKWLADVLIKHVVDAIINERELGFVTPEKRAEIQGEVEVAIDG